MTRQEFMLKFKIICLDLEEWWVWLLMFFPCFVCFFSIGLRDETVLNILLEVKNDKISYDSLKNTYTFKNLRNKTSPDFKVNENEKKNV